MYLIRYNWEYNAFLGTWLFPLLFMRIANEECVRESSFMCSRYIFGKQSHDRKQSLEKFGFKCQVFLHEKVQVLQCQENLHTEDCGCGVCVD